MEIKSSATNITISDMTIKDYDEDNNGGAVDITSGGTITFQDIHFDNNETTSSSDKGGAVYIGSGNTITFDRCKFTNNESFSHSSAYGSCVYTEGTTTFKNCLFFDNICNDLTYAGHVYVDDGVSSFINCSFIENGAGSPIRFYSDNGTHTVKNCIFYNNTSSYDMYELLLPIS